MRLVLVLAVAAAAACQLVLPIHEEADGDAADASIDALGDVQGDVLGDVLGDAGDEADDADGAGPTNLLLNAGFEQGLADAGCGPYWTYSNAVYLKQPSSIVHSGQRACELCTTGTQSGVTQIVAVNFPANSSYAFGGWVAPVPPDTTVTGRGFFTMHVTLPDGGTQNQFSSILATSTDGGWVPLFQNASSPDPGDQVQLSLQFTGNADGGCILIDDGFVVPQ